VSRLHPSTVANELHECVSEVAGCLLVESIICDKLNSNCADLHSRIMLLCNIWNYDERNLSDEPGHKKVVTKHRCKYPERIINSTKSCVSLMFCGNAEGELLPPYVVYKAESLWSTWMEHGPYCLKCSR